MSAIRLQLLLKPLSRSERGREDAKNAAQQLGLEISGEGAATLSARCSREEFVAIFGAEPKQGPGGNSPVELTVPNALLDFVSSVTVAPQHTYMRGEQ